MKNISNMEVTPMNKSYVVFKNGMLWTRTYTQHKAIRLVNDMLKNGITASWAEVLQ